MRTLFFDCETTGKCDFKRPPGDPRQPRLVQLAAVLTEGQEELASLSCVVCPTGFTIPEEASGIHGITTEKALASGLALGAVLDLFHQMMQKADGFVAHNIDFDRLIMTRELGHWPSEKPAFCTMKATTALCNLPGPYGPKWPKLSEAYQHFFREPLANAHDALADVRACMRVYNWLHARGLGLYRPATGPAVGGIGSHSSPEEARRIAVASPERVVTVPTASNLGGQPVLD